MYWYYLCKWLRFLSSIDKQVKYRTTFYIEDGTADTFYKIIDKITRKYNKAGLLSDIYIVIENLNH